MCSNVTGTNKVPLVVIRKLAEPRTFKNVNMNSLPVYCNAWISAQLFKKKEPNVC